MCSFLLFFSLLLIFTLLAASISHFLTAPIKFSCFSPKEIGFLYLFISRSSSRSVINIKVDINIQSKERLSGTRLRCCFFFFLKVRVTMQFTTEMREYLTCEILPLSYIKGWTYIPTIFSEIKFLGCIDNKIFLPMVLHFAHLKRVSEADNYNNSNNNSNFLNK